MYVFNINTNSNHLVVLVDAPLYFYLRSALSVWFINYEVNLNGASMW